MLLSQLRFKASMVNGSGTFWHACSAWALSTCQHHTSRDCSAWAMQEEASWDPNRDWFQSWITQYIEKSKTYKQFFVLKTLPFSLTALIIEFTRLITTPRGKLYIINRKLWAHLWWLHYDVCWWLCNVHGLHPPSLLINCLTCTRNVADSCLLKIDYYICIKETRFLTN